jgi:hypothetical protein
MNKLIEPSVVELLNKSVESAVAQKLLSAQSNQEHIKSELEKLSATIEANRKAELSSISQILKLLGKSSGESIKSRKTTKLDDNDIKEKLKEILLDQKLSGKSIQDKIGITYARFNIFLERNPSFLGREGERKTTLYFLQ